MGLSTNTYVYSGGARTFPVNFALGFLNRDDVTVYVEGEFDSSGQQIYREFTWNSDSEIVVTDPIDTTQGNKRVTVQRTVSKEELVVDFNAEGSATRRNLQFGLKQAMMAMHEFIDGRITALEEVYPFNEYIDDIEEVYTAALAIKNRIDLGALDTSVTNAAASQTAAATANTSAVAAQAASEAARDAARTAASNAQSSARVATTWTVLSGLTGSQENEGAEVLDSDAGTHAAATATGYDGDNVNNSGRYSWNSEWGRWVRIGDTGLSGKLDVSETDGTSAELYYTDPHGFVVATTKESGISGTNYTLEYDATATDDLSVRDKHGFVSYTTKKETKYGFTDAQLASLDNEALSETARTTPMSGDAKLSPGYLHFISTGQSLSVASEGWPVLTDNIPVEYDLYQVGDSIRPRYRNANSWTQVGSQQLNPLTPVVQSTDLSEILTSSEVANLDAGDTNPGEQVEVAALYTLKQAMLNAQFASRDSSRKIVATACGVGGQTIENLTNTYYGRITGALDKVSAVAAGQEHIVPAVMHLQGEGNLGSSTKTAFKTATKTYLDNIAASVRTATEQDFDPVFFTYQTLQTANRQRVAQAQLEMMQEDQNIILVAPHYAVTDKGLHLDANGYRWLGCYFGKAMRRVFVDGVRWKPLHPIFAKRTGAEVVVGFHVPAPPLTFRDYYSETTPKNLTNKGFAAYLASGDQISITNVELNGSCSIKINLGYDPEEEVYITYADGGADFGVARNGGNVADSDEYIAPFNYEYTANTGQYTSANITNLVNKPYPMQNFCVAFRMITQEA